MQKRTMVKRVREALGRYSDQKIVSGEDHVVCEFLAREAGNSLPLPFVVEGCSAINLILNPDPSKVDEVFQYVDPSNDFCAAFIAMSLALKSY